MTEKSPEKAPNLMDAGKELARLSAEQIEKMFGGSLKFVTENAQRIMKDPKQSPKAHVREAGRLTENVYKDQVEERENLASTISEHFNRGTNTNT